MPVPISEQGQVLELLDALHAAEHAGARAMDAWLVTCPAPAIRGGLRVIAARDHAHARLAGERIRALGGSPQRAPAPALVRLLELIASPVADDAVKLQAMASRLPEDESYAVRDAAQHIDDDRETRALIETMGDDDAVSLAWLREVSVGQPGSVQGVVGPVPGTGLAIERLQIAEQASATVFRAWASACGLDGLAGGLATIAAREHTHATLLTERMHELEHVPELGPIEGLQGIVDRWGTTGWSDEAKLDALLARYPADGDVAEPVEQLATRCDVETRVMLRLIAGGEQATIAWLRAYREAG